MELPHQGATIRRFFIQIIHLMRATVVVMPHWDGWTVCHAFCISAGARMGLRALVQHLTTYDVPLTVSFILGNKITPTLRRGLRSRDGHAHSDDHS